MNRTFLALAFAAVMSAQLQAAPMGTAFTYQGKLNDGGVPANGTYDFQMTLYSVSTGGTPIPVTLPAVNPELVPSVAVSNGLFMVKLDFGVDVFKGDARWLNIQVKTNSNSATFADLPPRQELTPTPYAIFAGTAGTVTNQAITTLQLAPNAVTGPAIANGNVVRSLNGLTDALTLAAGSNILLGTVGNTITISGAGGSSPAWLLGGNGGTTPGTDFLGTTDNKALEIKVNGQRAMRIDPAGGRPNLAGGSIANYIDPLGVAGSVIGGGESNRITSGAWWSSVGGGFGNQIGAWFSSVGGGRLNQIAGEYSAIGGGISNAIGSRYDFIGAGAVNAIGTNDYAALVGGDHNSIFADGGFVGGGRRNANYGRWAYLGGGETNFILGDHAVISGGGDNYALGSSSVVGGGTRNYAGGDGSVAAGGADNSVTGDQSTVGGGLRNRVAATAAGISGGLQNTNLTTYGTIGGGALNYAESPYSTTIGGGYYNTALGQDSTIGGGSYHLITSNHIGSTIAGGQMNKILTDDSVAGIELRQPAAGTIGGGVNNRIIGVFYGTIAGGFGNVVSNAYDIDQGWYASDYVAIGGGAGNVAYRSRGGVIGGGEGNAILGNYSTISGGWENIAASGATVAGGTSNRVDGALGVVAGGTYNLVSSYAGVVSGGAYNTAYLTGSAVLGGISNSAIADYSAALGGELNNVSYFNDHSTVWGKGAVARRPHSETHGAMFAQAGDGQSSRYVLTATTTSTGALTLLGPATPVGSAISFTALISAKAFGDASAGFEVKGLIRNYGGLVAFVGGAPSTSVLGRENALSAATVTAVVGSGGSLAFTVQSGSGLQVRWVCTLQTSEVSF